MAATRTAPPGCDGCGPPYTLCVRVAILCTQNGSGTGTVSVRYQGPEGQDVTHDISVTLGGVYLFVSDCFDNPTAGDWTVTVTPPTGFTWSQDCQLNGPCAKTVTVAGGTNLSFTFDPDTYDIQVQVTECCGGSPLEGCSVSATAVGGGGGSGSGVTDASGLVTFTLPNPAADSIDVTVSPPSSPLGYDSASYSFTPGGLGPQGTRNLGWGQGGSGSGNCYAAELGIQLPTTTSYGCGLGAFDWRNYQGPNNTASANCPYPFPLNLSWSDEFGSCTLYPLDNYGNPLPAGATCKTPYYWQGSYSHTITDGGVVDAYGNCVGPQTVTVDFTVTVWLELKGASPGSAIYWQFERSVKGSCTQPFNPADPPGTCYVFITDGTAGGRGALADATTWAWVCDPSTPVDFTDIQINSTCPQALGVRHGHLSE